MKSAVIWVTWCFAHHVLGFLAEMMFGQHMAQQCAEENAAQPSTPISNMTMPRHSKVFSEGKSRL
jgi:hypothetical protein